jgi:threonine synthase
VIRGSRGTAIAVTDEQADAATRDLGARSGIDVCPEGGAAWAALGQLRERGFVRPDDKVVVFNTGTGLKYR